ncbi:hypothetical protein BDY21DRAFT_286899 [Lineolata rhizophorae]|uniref:SAM and PH domain-containing protein n=1 Tax=Lineolata rhizophorae TaxID=578093 RepID=A0A6A6NYP1_9PEZI|nr:hypothetical protein BDY21DRAFT_286899 [Lineolata rhizophorae]
MTPITPLEPGVEMFQSRKYQPLIQPRTTAPRPLSEATEIFDTDLDGDDSSEFEEDSPKYSFESNDGRRSQTTISTYDEVSTPRSGRRSHFELHIHTEPSKPVEGPKGPHLFRTSHASSDFSFDYALQMSPLLPKESPLRAPTAFRRPMDDYVANPYDDPTVDMPLDTAELPFWSAQQVALWMANAGFDQGIVEKFEIHDITGTVLIELQFDHLKELGIASFGKRHRLWTEIQALRGTDGQFSPVQTPFQDVDSPVHDTKPQKRHRDKQRTRHRAGSPEDVNTPNTPAGNHRRRGRKHRQGGENQGTPLSIVAIEQLVPKPHKCHKGEKCPKWRKQQRQLARLQEENRGFPISPENGGHIVISGDPGNPHSADKVVDNVYRPTSENVPSLVASSDILGPGQLPDFALQEEMLRSLESRDPQENVKQFLSLQKIEPPAALTHSATATPIVERPPTPPLDMFPPLQPPSNGSGPHSNLKSLPRLSIPESQSSSRGIYSGRGDGCSSALGLDPDSAVSPCRTAITAVASPGGSLYRFGTPCSEMDVPVTSVPLGPVSRDTSQSVPPNMLFRDPIARSASRATARPSFVLPSLNEGEVYAPPPQSDGNSTFNTETTAVAETESISFDKERASTAGITSVTDQAGHQRRTKGFKYENVNHAGWMKKRRTRLLRHEWQDHHFRLTGTQLAMHENELPSSGAIDTIDVDDYTVACSSLASNKLAAKLKSLKIAGGAAKKDGSNEPMAFTFQLVPAGGKDGNSSELRKLAVIGGKSYHFATKTRDDRIEWMRELMLAKALKAKGEGYEVNVNGESL